MPDSCLVCGQDFKIEPGFYIGALWTSFPIVIFIMTLLSVLLLVYLKMELNLFFVVLTAILFLLQPIIIRYGRAIWIHVFVDYDSNAEIK
jgi:succinate-acetate transporter protein